MFWSLSWGEWARSSPYRASRISSSRFFLFPRVVKKTLTCGHGLSCARRVFLWAVRSARPPGVVFLHSARYPHTPSWALPPPWRGRMFLGGMIPSTNCCPSFFRRKVEKVRITPPLRAAAPPPPPRAMFSSFWMNDPLREYYRYNPGTIPADRVSLALSV